MVRRVYKYTAYANDTITFLLPPDAEILRVDVQDEQGIICLWALVDSNVEPNTPRKIRIAGTGHDIREEKFLKYINTFTVYEGKLWFHAFEIL